MTVGNLKTETKHGVYKHFELIVILFTFSYVISFMNIAID
jgi:hypothetical protein